VASEMLFLTQAIRGLTAEMKRSNDLAALALGRNPVSDQGERKKGWRGMIRLNQRESTNQGPLTTPPPSSDGTQRG
jgi:hypothetical protein